MFLKNVFNHSYIFLKNVSDHSYITAVVFDQFDDGTKVLNRCHSNSKVKEKAVKGSGEGKY